MTSSLTRGQIFFIHLLSSLILAHKSIVLLFGVTIDELYFFNFAHLSVIEQHRALAHYGQENGKMADLQFLKWAWLLNFANDINVRLGIIIAGSKT